MLNVVNLTKKYKKDIAVNKFNVTIQKGHIYGFIGPNGAGKTTFFKMLAGLVIPTEGEITVASGEKLEDFRRKMSFMIETPYLYERMTAFENIKIIAGIKGETNEKNLNDMLELVKLQDTGKKKVKDFSLGMRQRLGIACALTGNPEVIVLDEPMNGVDPEGIVELRELILSLVEKKKITVMISSHILSEMYQLSTDFIFMKQGNIVKKVSKQELDKLTSGIIEIGTEEKEKLYDFLVNQYGAERVTKNNSLIYLRKGSEQLNEISKHILDSGFTFTKISEQSVELEKYYMDKIVGNKHD